MLDTTRCPLCSDLIDHDGVCTGTDCPFIACPFCKAIDGIAVGTPRMERGYATPSCSHLILLTSGEVPTSALAEDIPLTSDAVLLPPGAEWFERYLDRVDDLTPFMAAEGLPIDETLELSEGRWTDDMLEWICPAVASRHGAVERVGQLGVGTHWVADPVAYWSDVVGHITNLKEWVWARA